MNDQRLNEIFQLILSISLERYDIKGNISEKSDQFDAIIASLNMLADQLKNQKENHALINHIYNTQSSMIFVCDKQGKIQSWNESAIKILKISRHGLFLKNIDTILPIKKMFNKVHNEFLSIPYIKLTYNGINTAVYCTIKKGTIYNQNEFIIFITDISEINQNFQQGFSEILKNQSKKDRYISNHINEQISQNLAAIKFFLISLKTKIVLNEPTQIKALNEIIDLSDQTLQSLKLVTKEILPTTMNSFSVIESVDELLLDLKKKYPAISFNFESINWDEFQLNSETDYCIYKIITEFLDSSSVLSNPSEIKVSLKKREHDFVLNLWNNGFQRKNKSMMNHKVAIQTRILALKGDISCFSFGKNQAEIKVSFPFC